MNGITLKWPAPRDFGAPPIVTGSICSGVAMKMLDWEEGVLAGVPHIHAFACGKSRLCQLILDMHLSMNVLYKAADATFMTNAPACDVLSSGFPCRSFSVAGLRRGCEDERSHVIAFIIHYAEKHVPNLTIQENVPGLLTLHPEVMLLLLQRLKADNTNNGPAYWVHWRLLSSITYDVARHRERLYILCTLRLHGDTASPVQVASGVGCRTFAG